MEASTADAQRPTNGQAKAAAVCKTAKPNNRLTKSGVKARQEGMTKMDEGRYRAAMKRFDEVLDDNPGNLAALALSTAAAVKLTEAEEDARERLSTLDPLELEAPPTDKAVKAKVQNISGRSPTVSLVSSKPALGDQKAFFKRLGIEPTRLRTNDGLPAHLPQYYRNVNLTWAIVRPEQTVLLHGSGQGRYVTVADQKGNVVQLFDFATWGGGEDRYAYGAVKHAQAHEGVLYALLNKPGQGDYLAAIDITEGALMWRTASWPNGGAEFEIFGGHIYHMAVTGRGRSLNVVSRADGSTVQKHKLPGYPSFMVSKGSSIHVRAGGEDLEFAISEPAVTAGPGTAKMKGYPSSRENVLGVPKLEYRKLKGADRCALEEAVTALDEGRYEQAEQWMTNLKGKDTHPTVVAIGTAISYALQLKDDDEALDLASAKIIRVRTPTPLKRLVERVSVAAGSVPNLVEGESIPPTYAASSWALQHDLELPFSQSSVREVPEGVPETFGKHPLKEVVVAPDKAQALIYGERYVAVTKGGKVRAMLDFKSYTDQGTKTAKWPHHAKQRVVWAEARGDTLFVSTSARSHINLISGFVTAVKIDTGELMWRSEANVANDVAGFVIRGGYLISGSGFSGDKTNRLNVLSLETGELKRFVEVDSAPHIIVVKGNELFVKAYLHQHRFQIQ